MKDKLAIPGSILLGSIIIAIAIHLGLNERHGDPAAMGPAATAPAAADPSRKAPGLEPPAPVAPPAPRPTRSEVEDLAREAFERVRPLMLERCWKPALAKVPEPATSRYSVDVTFDGSTGRAVALGISDLRDEPSRPDVGQCLRELPMDYAIDPPGETSHVQIFLTFP